MQPKTALEVREELEALIRRAFARYGRSPYVNADVDAILAAADAYRDAPAPFTPVVMHLEGTAGMTTACRRRWQCPEGVATTGNSAHVTCGKCKRSLRYRDMTAGAERAA